MRFLKLITLAALILAISGTTWAISLTPGPQEGKMNDFTSIYRPPSIRAGQVFDPLLNPGTGSFVPVFPGDENRAIYNTTTITPDVGGSPPADFVGVPGVEQLSGMFYDLEALGAVAPPPVGGSVTVEYGALGRNPILGMPAATGGVMEIYLDSGAGMTNFNELAANALGAGPSAWDEADSLGAVGAAYGHAVAPDAFPTINTSGETLFLQLVFIPFPGAGIAGSGVTAGTLVRETLANLGGDERGVGAGFAMIVGGTYAGNIETGARNASYASSGYAVPVGLSADFEIRFNIDPSDTSAPPWGAASDDPVKFGVIPEPVTMLGVFLAVGSLGGYLRRRRMG